MKKLIKNGMIATENEIFRGDILIDGEKIIGIGSDIDASGAEIIDASGKYVLPGAVDVHTHMDLDVGMARAIDDFYDGTVAAACGGTTTIVDHMAFGPKDCSLWHQVNEYHRLADGNAVVDYGFHGVIQHPVTADRLGELAEIKEKEGISSFKVYMTYDFGLTDDELFNVLRAAKEAGIVITVHCENHGLLTQLRKEFVEEGHCEAKYHPLSRPPRCEAEAVNRMIHLAAVAGDAPLYIVHLSSAEGLHEVLRARAEHRPNLGVETCTQYLILTDREYEDPVEGLKAIMSPPLRKDQDREELWQALADGTIDTVATDHCPFHFREGKAEKQYGKDDFTKCPNGAPGVQERLMLLFSEGFMKGRISLPQVVKYSSSNPCRMFGLYPQKGSFEPGTDADIVIIDPEKKTLINKEYIRGASDYSCYEGMELEGRIDNVFLRGEEIVRDGDFLGKRGDGKYLRRENSVLAK
jgi:dihydropyrimidinase